MGRLIASRLGLPFVDTDDVIAAAAGKPVHRIFAEEGEDHFRDLETDVIVHQISQLPAPARGDRRGRVLRPTNRTALTNGNFVIWLDAAPEVLVGRLHGHVATPDERPLLRGDEPLARLTTMATTRAPLYASCATLHVRSDEMTAGEIADMIVAEVERWMSNT